MDAESEILKILWPCDSTTSQWRCWVLYKNDQKLPDDEGWLIDHQYLLRLDLCNTWAKLLWIDPSLLFAVGWQCVLVDTYTVDKVKYRLSFYSIYSLGNFEANGLLSQIFTGSHRINRTQFQLSVYVAAYWSGKCSHDACCMSFDNNCIYAFAIFI